MSLKAEALKSVLQGVEHFLSQTLKKEKLSSQASKQKDELLKQIEALKQDYPALAVTSSEQENVESPPPRPNRKDETENGQVIEEDNYDYTDDDLRAHPSSPTAAPTPGAPQTEEFYEDCSSEHPESPEGPYADVSDFGIKKTTVAELETYSLIQGVLSKKRKEKGLINKFKAAFQDRYCVISKGAFYYFEKQNSKEQLGAFYLKDYEATFSPEITNQNKKKPNCFQINCPGKRNFAFIAPTKENAQKWIDAVTQASGYTPNGSLVENDDEYEEPDTTVQQNAHLTKKQLLKEPGEDTYDEASTAQPTKPALEEPTEIYDEAESSQQTPQRPSKEDEGEIYDDGESFPSREESLPPPPDDMLYDEGESVSAAKQPLPDPPPEIYDEGESAPVRPKPFNKAPAKLPEPEEQEIYDEAESSAGPVNDVIEEDIYEECDAPVDSSKPPIAEPPKKKEENLATRKLPETPPPPPPSRAPDTSLTDRKPTEVDYENTFRGLWDCTGGADDELSFKRGDMLRIISREYNAWWVGADLNGKIGLVPKDYLMPAYELVN